MELSQSGRVFISMFIGSLLVVSVLFAHEAFAQVYIPTETETGLSSGGDDPIFSTLVKVARWITTLIGVITLLVIVISGIMYITSGGDQTRVDNAKRTLTYAISGLVVALMAFGIVWAIETLFGAG